MSWRDKPYWLKGGIYFLCVVLFILGLDYLLEYVIFQSAGDMGTLPMWIVTMISFPILLLFFFTQDSPWLILTIILEIIYLFLIGTIIGWIIGKIKMARAK